MTNTSRWSAGIFALTVAAVVTLSVSNHGQAQSNLPPVTLTYTYYSSGTPRDLAAVQAAANAIIQKKINATLILRPLDWGVAGQKLNLMFANGEKCDLVFGASWDGYQAHAADGRFAALDTLLPKYAPNLYKLYSAQYWNGAKVNNKLYGAIMDTPPALAFGVALRKDLAQKYKFDLSKVKTYADLAPYFAAIKQNEPGVTPISYAAVNELFAYFNWDPIDRVLGLVVRADDPNLKVFNAWTTPEVRNFFTMVRGWQQAGYMPRESVKYEEQEPDMRAGKLATRLTTWSPTRETELTTSLGYPFTGKSFRPAIMNTQVSTFNMASVCKTSDNPERAVMLLELMNTDPQLYTILSRGIEGKHWVWTDKSNRILDFPKGVSAENSGYFPNTPTFFGNNRGFYYPSLAARDAAPLTAAFNKSAKPSLAIGFAFDPRPVKTEVAQMNAVEAQYIQGFDTGVRDINTDLPHFINDLKQAGMDRVTAEAQRQLDAWKAGR